ncbi:MAG: hypothetical protein IT381_10100 [Deltaproteobacteria bacterium]|nr:hypothetical protein [Deltaproteobacteria bacterium]
MHLTILLLTVAPSPEAQLAARLTTIFGVRFDVEAGDGVLIARRGGVPERHATYGEAFLKDVAPLYFDAASKTPIPIVLFEDKRTFTRHTRMDAYGFYAYDDRTIYTYQNSGYGTLWHELMHALIHKHLACTTQDWFNEGLASFYEMAHLEDGHITPGFTNWRQPILHEALRTKTARPLRTLLLQTATTSSADLAEARFLFVYLWLHGQLVPFARAYMHELCPKAQGRALGTLAAAKLEALLGRPLAEIDTEFMALARKLGPNVQLRQFEKLEHSAASGQTKREN